MKRSPWRVIRICNGILKAIYGGKQLRSILHYSTVISARAQFLAQSHFQMLALMRFDNC